MESTDGIVIAEPEMIVNTPRELTSSDVPQQDRLDRIVEVTRLVATGVELEPRKLNMPNTASSKRHIDYMRHAAKVLGLLTDDGITPAGRTLAQLPSSRVLDFLSVQFELSTVGRMWKQWAHVSDLHHLDPETSVTFLASRGLSDSMAQRRGRTLRKWVATFKTTRVVEYQ